MNGESGHGIDVERAARIARQIIEGETHAVEGVPDVRRQPRARLGQRHLPGAADEQRFADPLLQKPDLVAHGRLRHTQFLAGAGETQMTRGRLKGADGR